MYHAVPAPAQRTLPREGGANARRRRSTPPQSCLSARRPVLLAVLAAGGNLTAPDVKQAAYRRGAGLQEGLAKGRGCRGAVARRRCCSATCWRNRRLCSSQSVPLRPSSAASQRPPSHVFSPPLPSPTPEQLSRRARGGVPAPGAAARRPCCRGPHGAHHQLPYHPAARVSKRAFPQGGQLPGGACGAPACSAQQRGPLACPAWPCGAPTHAMSAAPYPLPSRSVCTSCTPPPVSHLLCLLSAAPLPLPAGCKKQTPTIPGCSRSGA